MNRKGSAVSVGAFIMLFIGVIVALSLFSGTGGIASNVGSVVNTDKAINASFTLPAKGVEKSFTNSQAVTNFVAINASSGAVVPSTNYTITNYAIRNGAVTSVINVTSDSLFGSTPVNVSYSSEPVGYVTDSGSRSIVNLIIVFAALAIFGFVIYYVFISGKDLFR